MTGSVLKRRTGSNKKSLLSFIATSGKKKHRKILNITLCQKRHFSDALVVNTGSQKISVKEHEIKLMHTLDSYFKKGIFKISNCISDIKILQIALRSLDNINENVSLERLTQISIEIKTGTYKFKPLKSYKIPKKSVKLNKNGVVKYIKNFSVKEKVKFFKSMKYEKRSTKVVTVYRNIFEELLESKLVAKAIQLVLEKLIDEKK